MGATLKRGNRRPEIGNRNAECGTGIRNPESGIRNRKPEYEIQKPQITENKFFKLAKITLHSFCR